MTVGGTFATQTYWARASSSGTPILISWSNLPARRSAASSESGLFVAPITITGLLSFFSHDMSVPWSQRMDSGHTGGNLPSMHVRNCATIRLSISRCALSRFGVMASISSMKRRQGATLFASSNVSRRVFSDSPDMPDTTEGAEMLMKGTPSSYRMRSEVRHDARTQSGGCKRQNAKRRRQIVRTPAIACANIVFPQPGGPCRSTPLGGCTPVCK